MFLDHKQLIRPADIAGHFGDVADIHPLMQHREAMRSILEH